MVNTKIILIICVAVEDGEARYSQPKQDQKLTVVQIMNFLLQNSELKKVGKIARPFRCDLNQVPYNYTVEVTNGFFSQEKKHKNAKRLSKEALQIAEKREPKSKGKKKDISI